MLVEFADAGRARHVDFGDEAADHVEADEQHALDGELRADLGREPAVAVVERAAHSLRAGRQVAAVVARVGDARECVRDRLAVDEQDARVARLDDLGQVLLHDAEAAAVIGERLEDHVRVLVARLDHEDRAPAHAVERLRHDPAMLGEEGAHAGHVARNERWRTALGEPRRVHLLIHVAQAPGPVDDQRAGGLRPLEDV